MEIATSTESFAGDALLLKRDDWLATLVLNRPSKRNAVNRAMWEAFPDVLQRIADDESFRVVIVRGAGGTFSAGADIAEFAQTYATTESTDLYNRTIRTAQKILRDLPRPTLAMIEGACVGGGCGIALACDLRFAADTARFGITPARLGAAYSFADTLQLMEKVGVAAAKDILFSGRLLEADEAFRLRLVDRLVEPAKLEVATLAYAECLADLSQGTIRLAKAMTNAAADRINSELGVGFEAQFQAAFASLDFTEGRTAFVEHRSPVFRRD